MKLTSLREASAFARAQCRCDLCVCVWRDACRWSNGRLTCDLQQRMIRIFPNAAITSFTPDWHPYGLGRIRTCDVSRWRAGVITEQVITQSKLNGSQSYRHVFSTSAFTTNTLGTAFAAGFDLLVSLYPVASPQTTFEPSFFPIGPPEIGSAQNEPVRLELRSEVWDDVWRGEPRTPKKALGAGNETSTAPRISQSRHHTLMMRCRALGDRKTLFSFEIEAGSLSSPWALAIRIAPIAVQLPPAIKFIGCYDLLSDPGCRAAVRLMPYLGLEASLRFARTSRAFAYYLRRRAGLPDGLTQTLTFARWWLSQNLEHRRYPLVFDYASHPPVVSIEKQAIFACDGAAFVKRLMSSIPLCFELQGVKGQPPPCAQSCLLDLGSQTLTLSPGVSTFMAGDVTTVLVRGRVGIDASATIELSRVDERQK